MKKRMREEALVRRNHIPAEMRAEKSSRIMAHILQSPAFCQAETVFTYVSMGSEVDTEEIILQAWKEGKKVAVPKTDRKRVMRFLQITSFADLREGRFGVMEPISEEELIPTEKDLFLVPGALFDRKKNRIGYGGGYYDTYFEKYQGYRKIGLAFSGQISETEIPAEEYDIPLDDIVTENGWEA